MSTYTNPAHPNRIYKDCECCGDLFEPIGYEGIKNAYCGTCESELDHGDSGYQDETEWFWDSVKGEWVTANELTVLPEEEEEDEKKEEEEEEEEEVDVFAKIIVAAWLSNKNKD